MAGEFKPIGLQECRLFKRLLKGYEQPANNQIAAAFAQALPEICEMAIARMKLMPKLHPEFTLHDDVHLLRVTELMGRVLPEEVLESVLNPVEVALLILSAYFHD